jgi:membrane protease YdiL (CAAX protease family)
MLRIGAAVRRPKPVPDLRRPLVFFLLACALSWAAWLPLARVVTSNTGTQPGRLQYLHLIGTLGPLTAAYLVAAWTERRRGVRELTRRSFDWRVGWPWLTFALLGPTLMYLAAVLGLGIVTGSWTGLSHYGESSEYPELPRILYWASNIVFYGFGEEVGWRGYLIPSLQTRWPALGAALLFTPFWALWHLPLFWAAPGLSQMDAAGIGGWVVSLALGSVVLSWLFNATGSVLPAAIFHGTIDIAFTSPGPAILQTLLGAEVTLLALGLIVFLDPRTLRIKDVGECREREPPR